MSISHLSLAMLVVLVWGCNFVFIEFALEDVPPLLLCALRFFLASFPFIFFVKRPMVPFKWVILWGLVTFGLQFSLLFMGMHAGILPGLASLLVQTQVFFSIFFAAFVLGEVPTRFQTFGALISFTGIGLIAVHLDHSASMMGFLLIIAGAASWGIGNLITKKIGKVNMFSLVVWGSFISIFPFLCLSFIFEGKGAMMQLAHISWLSALSILYIAYISTLVGYGVWNWLVSRYSLSSVVPFTLLVPIIAMLCSMWLFNEKFHLWKLFAGLLVIAGLGINLLGTRLRR